MLLVIEFKDSEPTLKMWAYAQDIAAFLNLKLPKYEFESVSKFIDENQREYYRSRRNELNDFWERMFWMDGVEEFWSGEFDDIT